MMQRPKTDESARKVNEKFRKRSRNLIKKADQLAAATNTDVYLVLLREAKYTVFSSTTRADWPPTQDDLVSIS